MRRFLLKRRQERSDCQKAGRVEVADRKFNTKRGRHMKAFLPLPLWLALACTITVDAHAELYKWVGEDGKITYSDTPPPGTAKKVEKKSIEISTGDTTDLPFELADARKKNPVTLYTATSCVPCEDGRALLSARGIPFSEKTVTSTQDVARLKQVSGDSQLPVLVVGSRKRQGYDAEAWNTDLTSAGYPVTTMLPKAWSNPAPQAAAPIAAPSAPPATSARGSEPTPVTRRQSTNALTAPAGNAPPGFRF
jgi:glutaredoxin